MLTTNQQEIDLGRLKFGETKNFTYTVTNSSEGTLEISKLGVGCTSCTKAKTENTTLTAGQSGIINVAFTPGSEGVQLKRVTVYYNFRGVSVIHNLVLKFKADVYS